MCTCDPNNSSYPKLKLGLFLKTSLNENLFFGMGSWTVRGILLTSHSVCPAGMQQYSRENQAVFPLLVTLFCATNTFSIWSVPRVRGQNHGLLGLQNSWWGWPGTVDFCQKITVCISLFQLVFLLVTRKGQFFCVRKEKIDENTSSFVPVICFIFIVLIFLNINLGFECRDHMVQSGVTLTQLGPQLFPICGLFFCENISNISGGSLDLETNFWICFCFLGLFFNVK